MPVCVPPSVPKSLLLTSFAICLQYALLTLQLGVGGGGPIIVLILITTKSSRDNVRTSLKQCLSEQKAEPSTSTSAINILII